MAELAGHKVVVEVSVDDGANWLPVACNTVELTREAESIDISKLGDLFRRRLLGIRDRNIPIAGDYDAASTGQAALDAAHVSGATVRIGLKWAGAADTRVSTPVVVANFNVSGSRDGAVSFSCDCQGNGVIA